MSAATWEANRANAELDKAWFSVHFRPDPRLQGLEDGIPDGWFVHNWGGALGSVELVAENSHGGSRFARIVKRSGGGATSLGQRFAVHRHGQLNCAGVYRMVSGSAFLMLFDPKSALVLGDAILAPASEWRPVTLIPVSVEDRRELILYVGLRDESRALDVDDLSCEEASDGLPIGPLLRNGGLEEDGSGLSPKRWWADQLAQARPAVPDLSDDARGGLASGRLDAARLLAGEELPGNRGDCAAKPGRISWLLALGARAEREAGPEAREKLDQLAAQLAPECPQPLGDLASLYRDHDAFSRSAELFRAAGQLAGSNVAAGAYFFQEGLVRLRSTGEVARASEAFGAAEALPGWEAQLWDRGAASAYLGMALEQLGDRRGATAAYERVLGCARCVLHHDEARAGLRRLSIAPIEASEGPGRATRAHLLALRDR